MPHDDQPPPPAALATPQPADPPKDAPLPDAADADAPQPTPAAAMEIAPALIAVVELSGPYDGRGRTIAGHTALLGRDAPELTLSFPYDSWISAVHARLTYRDGVWWLEDERSRNGTWVEGGARRLAPNTPEAIAPGQVFRLGHTDLMLSTELVHGDEEATPI